jgi:chromosome segregation ATPase
VPSLQDETAHLRVQISSLNAEKVELHQQFAMQGHAYRGCQLVIDETKEEVAELQAKLKDFEEKRAALKAGMKSIRELTDKVLDP